MKQTKKPTPIHPGEILLEEFLKPMGISQYALAKAIAVPPRRINEIVHGNRAITADTDLRLCKFFGLTEGYWLRGQARYDTEIAKDKLGDVLSRIQHFQPLAA
ncbi:MAG: HigA family addiction module antitoxin [Gallionella sp.]